MKKFLPVPINSATKTFKSSQGFTLLEVLVAMAIFSVIAIISYSTLDTYIDHRTRLTTHYSKLEQLQRLFILLERDIQFAINRKVRTGGDRFDGAFLSENGDAFLTLSVALPDINAASGSALKRVQWRLEGSDLIRSQWDALDQDNDNEPREQVISEEVNEVEVNYFLYEPRRGVDSKSSLNSDEFPSGVEVILHLTQGQTYRRVFAIAMGSVLLSPN